RTLIAQGRVLARSVVVAFNICEGLQSRLLDFRKHAAFEQFRLVTRKKALGVRVVICLISAAHTLLKSVLPKQTSKLGVHILPAEGHEPVNKECGDRCGDRGLSSKTAC